MPFIGFISDQAMPKIKFFEESNFSSFFLNFWWFFSYQARVEIKKSDGY